MNLVDRYCSKIQPSVEIQRILAKIQKDVEEAVAPLTRRPMTPQSHEEINRIVQVTIDELAQFDRGMIVDVMTEIREGTLNIDIVSSEDYPY
jgi:DNA-directed RNA polymerase specialized sigma subunit